MTFIDSLYVIAFVNSRDQHHVRALELSDLYDGTPLLSTDAVLLEIGNALARRFKQQATEAIHKLTTYPEMTRVSVTTQLFDRGFKLFSSHADKEWCLVDCISFVVMRDFGVTDALTHDIHFQQAGFRALMRDEP